MKKALITQTAIFVGWLALALTLALGGPVGCSKKKDRNQSGHVVFPHHNPNGLTPIPRRGIVTGSGQTPLPTHRASKAVNDPSLREALDVLVLHGGESGKEIMQGIVADLESGRLNVRYPGREDTRYVKPEISAVMVDVCLERFLEKADLDEVLDFDSFTACNEPLFISMRTLAQFASAKRNKLGGNPHAITVAYAHVLAGQWVVSHSWREDKLFFANQPKVFQAIFAPDDLAWKEGSGIDEAHGRTLRVLFQVYRQVQTFKISMILAQAGMPSGLLSILNDRDLTVGYVVRRVREDQTIDLSQGLTGRLFDTAYATPNFGKFMESLQSGVGEEDTLFARTLSEVKTEWNLTVPAEEE